MTPQEAKAILQYYKPNDEHSGDNLILAAMEVARRDPELRAWWEEQCAMDTAMASAIKALPVPSDLDHRLIEQLHGTPPRPKWVSYALMGALGLVFVLVLGLSTWGGWLFGPASLADFQEAVIRASWLEDQHVTLPARNLDTARAWLAEHAIRGKLDLPQPLTDYLPFGCKVVRWHGEDVAVLCFLDGLRHVHLYVIDENAIADPPPPGRPHFSRAAGWQTVSWTRNGHVYVLTGISYNTFVKRFRADGQWQLKG